MLREVLGANITKTMQSMKKKKFDDGNTASDGMLDCSGSFAPGYALLILEIIPKVVCIGKLWDSIPTKIDCRML
jgi:hypothetical protein